VVAGWKNEGLPWSYDLIAAKMYFNFDPKIVRSGKQSMDEASVNQGH
jgi:hypothetical protein